MLKYHSYAITMQEVPDEISLCINISNCPHHCEGCHSSYLAEDVGKELYIEVLDNLIEPYKDFISCVCFMGGDQDTDTLVELLKHLNGHYKTAVYTGLDEDKATFPAFYEAVLPHVNFLKTGHYDANKGPLNAITTNQRMYKLVSGERIDITPRFWKKEPYDVT